MAKPDSNPSKKQKKKTSHWVIKIFLITILVSGVISLTSEEVMSASGIAVAFLILLVIVMIGIIFDVIGVAVTSADETPFHSMAARKVPGAQESIRLLRKAERVSSICNDVVGDICGVVSGSASATITLQILENFEFSFPKVLSLTMSALVAGVTVGGKAIGKTFAVNSSTTIVHAVGKCLYWFRHFPEFFKRRKKK